MINWETYKNELDKIREEIDKEYPFENHKLRNQMAITTLVNRHRNRAVFDLFDAIDWLTQEAESEEEAFAKQMEKCSMCNGFIDGCCETAEPQQSKARFIECYCHDLEKRIYINEKEITAIHDLGGNFTDIYAGHNIVGQIQKPTNEVIQQLGIEVV